MAAPRFSLFRRCQEGLDRLRRDRGGSVLPLIAVSLFVLVGSAGLAVDGARLMLMHSKLQASIDAAGLSAVARLSTTDYPGQVSKFARANFLDGYVGAEIAAITAVVSNNAETLTVTATASAPTSFMQLFNIKLMSTSASTTVTRAMGGLEVALILDVTGSMDMNGNGRIASLKTASNTLLNILFGSEATVDKLHVGIVPFSQAVNIGTGGTRGGWVTGSTTNWEGCVQARFSGRDIKDDPPGDEKFKTYFSEDYCPPPITPLTSTKATLVAAIKDLKAQGGTQIVHGAEWGWNLLSPRWRGVWGGTMGTTLPLNYGVSGMSKAAVIMTDGENSMNDDTAYGKVTCTGSNSLAICSFDPRINISATARDSYRYDGRNIVYVTASENAKSDLFAKSNVFLDDKLKAVCTNMKNASITLYTVALGNPGENVKTLLRGCASQSAFFFDSPTNADLQTAFAKIGDSLSSLRVSR